MAPESIETLKETIRALEERLTESEVQRSTLKQSEQKYRHFFEESPTMIYVVDMHGVLVNINDAGARMLGFKNASDVIGKRFDDYFLADRHDLRRWRRVLEKKGVIDQFDTRMKRIDGRLRDVQFSTTLRRSVTGKVNGYEGFVIDITDRKTTEKQLVESEIKYKTVLDNSLAAIYMFQEGGYFSYANPRMVSVLGYNSADEIIGMPFWETIAPEDRETVKERGLAREKREFRPRRYKFRMIKKNGEKIWVDMRAAHASYLGKPAVVGNFIDITREVKAEEQVRRLTGRVIEAIEEERRSLANDIHDEFGQLLTLLQFDVEALHTILPNDSPEILNICNKVMVQIQHLADAVRDTTSRLRPDMLDHLGLVPTLQWYINDFKSRRSAPSISFQSIGLKKRIPADVELVIYRVFQEGMNNISKHALASQVNLQLTYNHPDIIFIVKDDGCGFLVDEEGMPSDSYRKGIGLLSMKERVTSIGGTMTLHSRPGKGTAIRIKIPIYERKTDGPH
jgi:PAS domain S-box-containing protein